VYYVEIVDGDMLACQQLLVDYGWLLVWGSAILSVYRWILTIFELGISTLQPFIFWV
jgi:F0F1-type ATP synthase membrane subunit a